MNLRIRKRVAEKLERQAEREGKTPTELANYGLECFLDGLVPLEKVERGLCQVKDLREGAQKRLEELKRVNPSVACILSDLLEGIKPASPWMTETRRLLNADKKETTRLWQEITVKVPGHTFMHQYKAVLCESIGDDLFEVTIRPTWVALLMERRQRSVEEIVYTVRARNAHVARGTALFHTAKYFGIECKAPESADLEMIEKVNFC